MRVSDLMCRDLITVEPNDSVEEAVKLLRNRGVRHLLVMKRYRLVGIISDRDIKRALDPRKTRRKLMDIGGLYFLLEPILVEEIMTPDPVSVSPETFVEDAAAIMVQRRFGALPVTGNGRILGILTETDLLRYFSGIAPGRNKTGIKDNGMRVTANDRPESRVRGRTNRVRVGT